MQYLLTQEELDVLKNKDNAALEIAKKEYKIKVDAFLLEFIQTYRDEYSYGRLTPSQIVSDNYKKLMEKHGL